MTVISLGIALEPFSHSELVLEAIPVASTTVLVSTSQRISMSDSPESIGAFYDDVADRYGDAVTNSPIRRDCRLPAV